MTRERQGVGLTSHAPVEVQIQRHEAPARTGILTASTSGSSACDVSPGGAHQHEAQAQAVTNGVWSATARGSVRGLRLIANAATAPTATSTAPMRTAGFMPSTNCWPEP